MAENRELALVLKLIADQFQSELRKSGGLLGEFQKVVSDWKVQLTAASGALFAIAKSTANYGEELLKTSQKIGIKVEALAGLQHAANMADLSNEQLSQSLKVLSQNMVEAARQTGDGEALFRRLGVSATDATGQLRPTEAVLLDLADVFAKAKDGAGKTEAAVKLFGKAGIDLIPFLNQGKTGITELMAEAQRLGLVMSKENAESANRFNDELKRLQASLQGVKLDLGQGLLPVMTGALDTFTKLTAKIKEMASESSNVSQNLKNWSSAFGQTGIGQGLMDLFTSLGFGHRKGEGTLPREEYLLDLLGIQKPGSGVLLPGSSSAGQAGEIAPLVDQERLGKAKLEIFLAQNRALEIQNKLENEGKDRLPEEFLAFDRQEQFRQEDEAAQERMGRLIVAQTQLAIKVRDDARLREQQGLIDNEQAWLQYGEAVGASNEFVLSHRLDLVKANLAKELDLNIDSAGRLLLAWQAEDEELADMILATTTKTVQEQETIMLRTTAAYRRAILEQSDDFFSGWAEGMRRYVKDTQSGFGMSADMARRAFQTMEQSAQQFFFNAMEGRITRLKDVFSAFLTFAKQVSSQLASQLIIRQLGSALAGAAPSFFGPSGGVAVDNVEANRGGQLVRRFAGGGPVPGAGNQDTVPAWLTPGEYVLSRRDVSDIKNGIGGLTVIVQNYGSNDVQTSTGTGPDGKQALFIVVRDAVRGMLRGGEMDGAIGARYGLTPKPFGR